MSERADLRVVSAEDLPLALTERDIAEKVLGCSTRTVERLWNAKLMPEPILLDRPGKARAVRRWSRDVILAWLSGGTPRRRGRR